MAIDFPASPTLGQTFTPSTGLSYVWNGYAWDLISVAAQSGVAAGSLVELQRKVVGVAVANLDFTSLDSTYDEYELHFWNARPSADSVIGLRISQDNGATFKNGISDYLGSNYYLPPTAANAGATATGSNAYGQVGFNIYSGSVAITGSGIIRFSAPSLAGYRKQFFWDGVGVGTAENYRYSGWTTYITDNNAFNAIRLFCVSGANFVQGTFVLFGRAKVGAIYVPPNAGTKVLLATIVPTAVATIDTPNGLFTSAYDDYAVEYDVQNTSATDVNMGMRISVDNGASYYAGASDYGNIGPQYYAGSTQGGFFQNVLSFMSIGIGNNITNIGSTGSVRLFHALSNRQKTARINFEGYHSTLGAYAANGFAYFGTNMNPITNLRFLWAPSGNFAAGGWIKIYGLR